MQVVTVDVSALTRYGRELARLPRRDAEAAIANAVNDTATFARTIAAREIATASGLKVGKVKGALFVVRAFRSRPQAEVGVSGKAIPLAAFRARQVRKGVVASAWGKRRLYRGAFLARMANGRLGAWLRETDAKWDSRGAPRRVRRGKNIGKPYRPHLPIREMFGAALPKVFAEERVRAAVKTATAQRLSAALARNIDRRLYLLARRASRR